jgi:sugar phosphate isomerase/epimerase
MRRDATPRRVMRHAQFFRGGPMDTEPSQASFALSAFGDEIVIDFESQLQCLRDSSVGWLDLRAAWGVGVLQLDDEMVARVHQLCHRYGIQIACIGSPVGKSLITDALKVELAHLERIFRIAERVGTRLIRIFSFYPPKGTPESGVDAYLEESVARLRRLAELARQDGFRLVLENEKGIVGDTVARCHALLSAVGGADLGFVWDTANFVQVGEARLTERGWPLLGEYVEHVHVKDARLADGKVCVAGAGEGQVREFLVALRERHYRGFLALEPHLTLAGHSSGFSGPDGMALAIDGLRKLMAELGCAEQKPPQVR